MERWDKIKQIPGKSLENIINILKLKKFEGIIDGLKRLKTKYFRVGPKYSKEIDDNLYLDQSGVDNRPLRKSFFYVKINSWNEKKYKN